VLHLIWATVAQAVPASGPDLPSWALIGGAVLPAPLLLWLLLREQGKRDTAYTEARTAESETRTVMRETTAALLESQRLTDRQVSALQQALDLIRQRL